MAVYTYNGIEEKVMYEGRVLNWYEHNGYEDSDWYAEVWDDETQSIKQVEFMTTRAYCYGHAELDATDEVLRKVYRKNKKDAAKSFVGFNLRQAKKIRKGDTVRIVKGRKVKKGLEVPVFWAGTTYNRWSRQNEERIGVDVDGERVFISAENAEPVGWESRLIHGKKRKKMIRRKALEDMPTAYRNYFR